MRKLFIFKVKTLIILCVLLCSCGKLETNKPSPDGLEPAHAPPPVVFPKKQIPGEIRGRIIGRDTGSAWKITVMEFQAKSPEVRSVLTALPDTTGIFQIQLPPLPFEVPFAVAAFQDHNGNDAIDHGEDFVGSRSIGSGYAGRGIFLLTDTGSFVGGRSWDLSKVTFEINVK